MPQIPHPEELQEHIQEGAQSVKQEVTASRKPWYYVSKAARVLLIVYAIQLTLFALLAWWIHIHPVDQIDITITREFQENPTGWLRTSMLFISDLGLWYVMVPLVVVTALLCWFIGLRLEAVFIAILPAVSLGLNTIIKYVVARPRPNAHLVNIFQAASGQSFPSGHVMNYLAFWGLIFSFSIILFKGVRWWRILLLGVSGLIVGLVGPSRVYLGAHWASDVLGSYLIGGVLLGLSLYLYLQLKRRGVLETRRIREHTAHSSILRPFPRR